MNNLVKVENNSKYGFVVSSRNVSIVVKRRHDNVMRDIEKIITEGSPQIRGLFIKSEYIASNGKKNKEYLLLKDGVILYLFNVQGLYEKKMAYINEFNRMEQALRKPKQTKLDFQNQTPIRTTWKGEPVIELVQLARYINMTSDNLHFLTKHDKVTLRYEKLMEFRKENPRRYNQSVNAISILFKETVIAICKKYGIYEKYKDFIENYFRVDNRIEDKTPKVPVVRENKEPFEDNYYNRMFECMKKAYIIESRIEKIYEEELLPLYNKIEELNRAKKNCLISPFNAMKYGSVLGKAKLNK
ncbi:phage regulatory protein Rha [Fusobacterium necrophorum subsp. funduliforme ATCC 51357]|uniref:Rha family transcriptional regulator n=1 Tax=Fusobacterium necrophorum TaxID=859 RepID=UPI00025E63E7|nr:Rha family transcriptional regulator [Fusobacterium necrophorum]EIJ69913.1 phage regulatory protein Rha [Fusobacterium necrophorum subsp. funduliforme ATCC 51357]KAB0553167.1 Rha family transcriptional regulator [Fusobacterium necrophorum subsp. funduliforme]